jgi:hypothetical protein
VWLVFFFRNKLTSVPMSRVTLRNVQSRQLSEHPDFRSPHRACRSIASWWIIFVLTRTKSLTAKPNVVVEWLAFLFRIREVLGSNIGLETGYPDWGFSWFSSVPPGKCLANTLNLATTTSFHILSYHYSLSFSHSTLYNLNCWKCRHIKYE